MYGLMIIFNSLSNLLLHACDPIHMLTRAL